MIKAGIVVSQYQSLPFFKILKKISTFSCVGFYDPETGTGKALEFGDSQSLTYSDFLAKTDAVVFENTCEPETFALIQQALKQSKHVYISDPLCLDVSESTKLLKLNQEIPSVLHLGNLSELQHYEYQLNTSNIRWINIRRSIPETESFAYTLKKCISQSNHILQAGFRKVDAFQLPSDNRITEAGEVRIEFFNGAVMNVQLLPGIWNEEYATEILWNSNYMRIDFIENKIYASVEGSANVQKPMILTYQTRIEKELFEFESFILNPSLRPNNLVDIRLNANFIYPFIEEKIKRTSISC